MAFPQWRFAIGEKGIVQIHVQLQNNVEGEFGNVGQGKESFVVYELIQFAKR